MSKITDVIISLSEDESVDMIDGYAPTCVNSKKRPSNENNNFTNENKEQLKDVAQGNSSGYFSNEDQKDDKVIGRKKHRDNKEKYVNKNSNFKKNNHNLKSGKVHFNNINASKNIKFINKNVSKPRVHFKNEDNNENFNKVPSILEIKANLSEMVKERDKLIRNQLLTDKRVEITRQAQLGLPVSLNLNHVRSLKDELLELLKDQSFMESNIKPLITNSQENRNTDNEFKEMVYLKLKTLERQCEEKSSNEISQDDTFKKVNGVLTMMFAHMMKIILKMDEDLRKKLENQIKCTNCINCVRTNTIPTPSPNNMAVLNNTTQLSQNKFILGNSPNNLFSPSNFNHNYQETMLKALNQMDENQLKFVLQNLTPKNKNVNLNNLRTPQSTENYSTNKYVKNFRSNSQEYRTHNEIICWKCSKPGHISKNCQN